MLTVLWILGCDAITVEKETHHSDTATDSDGDGYAAGLDCDDTNASIHPEAPETKGDGVDSNCDGNDDT